MRATTPLPLLFSPHAQICRALSPDRGKNDRVHTLNLAVNAIDALAVELLVEVIRDNQTLNILDLTDNDLGPKGGCPLPARLRGYPWWVGRQRCPLDRFLRDVLKGGLEQGTGRSVSTWRHLNPPSRRAPSQGGESALRSRRPPSHRRAVERSGAMQKRSACSLAWRHPRCFTLTYGDTSAPSLLTIGRTRLMLNSGTYRSHPPFLSHFLISPHYPASGFPCRESHGGQGRERTSRRAQGECRYLEGARHRAMHSLNVLKGPGRARTNER